MRTSNPAVKQLLWDLRGASSAKKFAAELGVISPGAVLKWFNQDDVAIQASHVEMIEKLARKRGIEPLLYGDPPKLWDKSRSFEENQKLPVPEPLPWRMPSENTESVFLGHELNSPVGASATILTSSAARIEFLASAGVDVITYKTVRSSSYVAHKQPNLYLYDGEVLDPDKPIPPIVVSDVSQGRHFVGLVNRFGVPSKTAEEWQADFKAAKSALSAGQLIILSVMGTAGIDDSADVLVNDFVKVSQLAVAADAQIIELNLSCPNCRGREGELYKDLDLTVRILKSVRDVAPAPRLQILAKIGYLETGDLEKFVFETVKYVQGYTAINSLAVVPVMAGQYGNVPVYPPEGTKAGLTGAPLRPFALRTVRALNDLRLRHNLSFAISGCGGVVNPEDVTAFLQSGADIVTIGTKLIDDPMFGLRVRQYLEGRPFPLQAGRTSDDLIRLARLHWYYATESIEGLMDSPVSMMEAHKVFATWCEQYSENRERAYRSDNRFRGGVPTREEFERMIRKAIRR